jgi:hypothetical protein
MTAAEALQIARAAAIRVTIDGDDLVLDASAQPASFVLDLLSGHKAGIVALLRSTDDGWSAEEWQVFFDERAGIAEFDGGLSRAQAETCAFACCAVEWLNRNPAHLPPRRCVGGGCGDHADSPLLSNGADSTGNWSLHSRCWSAQYAGRKAEAVAALAVMGITSTADLPNDFGKNGSVSWEASDRDGRAAPGATRWKPAARST